MEADAYTSRDQFLEDQFRQALAAEPELTYLEAFDTEKVADYASPWVCAQIADDGAHLYQPTEGNRSVDKNVLSTMVLIYTGVKIPEGGQPLEKRRRMRMELGRAIRLIEAALHKHFSTNPKTTIKLDGAIKGVQRVHITGLELVLVIRSHDEENFEGYARISGNLKYKSFYQFN